MEPATSMQSLRILHIISGDRWAGAEVQAYTLLKELAKVHDVHVILLNPGELADRLIALGINTRIIDESIHSSVKILLGLYDHIREIRPQIIHTHRQKENILSSIANRLSVRARCVRTVHGEAEFSPAGLGKIQIMLDDFCGKYLQDAIIAVSDDLKIKLATRFPLKKLHTVANGIDCDEVRQGLTVPDFKQSTPNAIHVGIVGRLDPVKRIDIFLETAALLLKEQPKSTWQFHIFGEGKLEQNMKALAVTLGVESHVIFHGHRMDIRSCINALDIVLMCSDHEGLPMTALECLALGKPIIAHSVGGLKNLLHLNQSYLVEDHSAQGYASGVRKQLNDSCLSYFPKEYLSIENANSMCKIYGAGIHE